MHDTRGHEQRQQRKTLDELIAESRRIQDAMIRMVTKLDLFADRLTEEAAKLQTWTEDNHERVPQGEDSPGSPAGRLADGEDGGTYEGNGGGEGT